MTDMNKEIKLSPDEIYLNGLLEIFNADPKSTKLDDTTKILLGQIRGTQQEIVGLSQQIDKLNNGIKELRDKGNELVEKLILKKGESQGYVNILLKIRK
ncbi:hypothetical protein LCGC14_1483850 [marine sediment metagenome]|uniref:Uncharacterized protein n=1 Tax=marine sediment metagenome TaxID=412755 RepID=A0A0F9MAJ0_9ZZZZ